MGGVVEQAPRSRPQEVLGPLAFGVNVHYHVGPGMEEEDRRRGNEGLYALLALGGCVAGALLTRVPWKRLLSPGRPNKYKRWTSTLNRLQDASPSLKTPPLTAKPAVKPVVKHIEAGQIEVEPSPEEPPGDMLALIEREKRRLAVAAAAEARASGLRPDPNGTEEGYVYQDEVEAATEATLEAAGFLLGRGDGELDNNGVSHELRQEIAVVTEEVRVFQEDASQADQVRRAVQKEAEAAERGAAAACKAHADAKEKLWRAEERLSSLLLKAGSLTRPTSMDHLNGGHDDAEWGVPGVRASRDSFSTTHKGDNQPQQEAVPPSTPSYIS